MNITKQEIISLLNAWIRQRSGMDWRDYGDGREGLAAYRSEARRITQQGRDARMLLREVELSSITAEDLIKAFSAYCGRLELTETEKGYRLEYCTGQYFPTEYRAVVCAILSRALWNYHRDDYKDGIELREMFKRRYGRRLSAAWFD